MPSQNFYRPFLGLKSIRIHSIGFMLLLLTLPVAVEAQALDKIIDFLTVHPNKKAVERDSSIHPAKAILTPVVSYAPETNLGFGLGVKGLFKMRGSGPETRTSNIPLSLLYTIDKKYQFFSGFAIFSPGEKYMLTGNINIQSFPSFYFGVGQNTPDSNEEAFGYRQILIEPILLKNIFRPYLYFGGGFRFNKIDQIEAEQDGLLALSKRSGANGSTSSGFQIALIYDSRDNILNASKGFYLELTHGIYSKNLGGSQNFELSRFDFRYYIPMFQKSRSTLAFQLMAHLSHGNTPLFELGRLGGHEIMRGYFEGRYTERQLYATQLEWRQKLNHRWGIIGFTGLGTVAPSFDQLKMRHVRTSFGVGLRFLIDPHENLNLRLDFGFGAKKMKYYFKIAEAF